MRKCITSICHTHFSTAKALSLVLSVLFLLPCCLTLVSCHGAKNLNAFDVPEEFDMSRTYEITFWAKNDTNATQKNIYNKAVEDFTALYPNIHVNIRFYTDYGQIYNDVITNISTGTTPNICITYPDHIATYMTGDNVVVPLDSLMKDKKFGLGGSEVRFDSPSSDELIPQYIEECRIGNDHYALPFMRSTEACYVNKDYVEKLGFTLPEVLTWDFVFEVSEAATKKNADGTYAINGQKTMIPFIYKSSDNMMIQMLAQKDADYSTPAGDVLIFNDTTRELLDEISTHAATGAFSTFKISSYPANFLNAGQCIFAIDSTAGATWMGSHAPNIDISEDKLVDFETVVYPVPQFDPDDPKMISQGPSICLFNKEDSGEVLASWLFASYLLSNDVQLSYCQTEGYVPVTSKARESQDYLDYLSQKSETDALHYRVKIEACELLINNTEYTFVTPVFNGSASLRNAAGDLIENVTKSSRRKQTIDDDYYEKLYSDMRTLYRLDQIESKTTGNIKDLGKMPKTAVILLGSLCVSWVLIGAYVVYRGIRKKKA
ncbi:MAG: extracellular solute-binding protein [Clostridiales bacterium]|nr:extracellular solute-binding protein [Clostridiales bacterium]